MSFTQKSLAGKAALVTGAAKRLGRAMALVLADEGCDVLVHYGESRDEAARLADELHGLGVRAWVCGGDLATSEGADLVWHSALEQCGAIDILINNASIFPESLLGDIEEESLFLNLRVNALAPYRLARHFAAQGREGTIVNILDTRFLDYDRKHVEYHLSKRMLFSLTRMMAEEYAPLVRVNAVAPGLVLPPAGKDEAYLEELKHTNPLQRYGSAQDVAEAMLYLTRSSFITGQVIFVDGGRHMRGSFYG